MILALTASAQPSSLQALLQAGCNDYLMRPLDEAVLKVPTQMSEELCRRASDVAARTFEAMGAEGLARVDLFITADGRVLVNEINTMPGFTHISMFPSLWAATGIDYTSLISDLIDQALERPLGLR